MAYVLKGYRRLEGSERRPHPSANLIGPSNANDRFSVTITLRRRPGSVPDFHYFLATPLAKRQRLPADQFAARYGALPADIDKVVHFATSHGITVVDTNAARRHVIASGTVHQMEVAFQVKLNSYKRHITKNANSQTETYRGLDGFIHVPEQLHGVVTGIFGLDNQRLVKHSSNPIPPNMTDVAKTNPINSLSANVKNANAPGVHSTIPPNTAPVTVQEMCKLYGFPTNSAAGQTIGILSENEEGEYAKSSGYKLTDIEAYFKAKGIDPPKVRDVAIDGSGNPGNAGGETTMDIVIAADAAPGASIAVFFCDGTQKGWVDLVTRVAHPGKDDPVCSVLSSSWLVDTADDNRDNSMQGWMDELSRSFQDAAIQGVTVCNSSGDWGAPSWVSDGKTHVSYPSSDPWILSCGGTTISNVDLNQNTCTETVWNDPPDPDDDDPNGGATGGGISGYFPVPSYQSRYVNLPPNLNGGFKGRGIPDVAANASWHSYYPYIVDGKDKRANGTSAAAPMWAALIALINAGLGKNVGFINPLLYAAGAGSGLFRDILSSDFAADNGFAWDNSLVEGYSAGPGWDCCTGFGSMHGTAIRDYILPLQSDIYIRDYPNDDGTPTDGMTWESPDIIVLQNPVKDPQAQFGEGSGNENYNNLMQNIDPTHDQSIYIRVLNKGGSDVTNITATVYYAQPATFIAPASWNKIGTTIIPRAIKGKVLAVSNVLTWSMDKQNPIAAGHYCFIVIIGDDVQQAPNLPQTLPDLSSYIHANKQVAMRNFNVIPAPPEAPPIQQNVAPLFTSAKPIESQAPPNVKTSFTPTTPTKAPSTNPAGAFHSFPFRIPGSFDQARIFRIESFGTLPNESDSQVELQIPTTLAKALKVQASQEINGSVVIKLPPTGRHIIGSEAGGLLEKDSIALCELRVKVGAHVYDTYQNEVNEFKMRQYFDGKEVGRITWHFGRHQKVVKK